MMKILIQMNTIILLILLLLFSTIITWQLCHRFVSVAFEKITSLFSDEAKTVKLIMREQAEQRLSDL